MFSQDSDTGFSRLLLICDAMEQTEPQDAFFAFRAFATDQDDLPFLDYTKPITKLCLEHALYFCRAMLGPAVLQFGGLASDRNAGKLPSWCPRWDQTSKATPRPLANIPLLAGSRMPESLVSNAFGWKYKKADPPAAISHSLIISAVLDTKIDALFIRKPQPRTFFQHMEFSSRIRGFVDGVKTMSNTRPPEIESLFEKLEFLSTADAVQEA